MNFYDIKAGSICEV